MALVQNLSSRKAAEMVGLHLKTFEKYLREGKLPDFPAPRIQPNGRRAWLSDEVEMWMRSRPRAQPTMTSGSPYRPGRELRQ